jgi:N-sulfoglucosamine sulfohydrolase
MRKHPLFHGAVGLMVWLCTMSVMAGSNRPNFLIVMADDCTYNDLPLYGGQNARTPNIDALAARGLTFNQAYLCSAMCQPCRSELFTGQYPLTNGCAWNHSASRPQTKSLPHFLKPLGYRVGISGKVHVKPANAFPFDKVPGFDPSCVREPTRSHDLSGIRDFMSAEKHDSPFCLVIALVEPHIPWVMGDASQYPPDQISLPNNLADTPLTRQHFADYLAEITYMDGQVGEILKTLNESGSEQNTLVLFTSEQGSQFPGCKWTNWDTGLHTALIASWPGHVPEVQRTDTLVQYADIAPTLLELAGGSPRNRFDGSSFAAVLRGEQDPHREFAYGMHNNLPEGPRYPIRSITNGRYRYIRNLLPEEIYIEKHLMGGGRLNNPYWATWVGADPLKHRQVYERTRRYMRRPAEQLYRTIDDSWELTNLADDAQHAEVKAVLSAALDDWLQSQSDPGAPVDTPEALQAARKGKHLHGRRLPDRSPVE